MSNVRDRETGRMLAEGREKIVLEWQGRKVPRITQCVCVHLIRCVCLQVGLVGLVEREWLVTLATVEPEDVEYIDFVTAAKALLPQLKEEVRERGGRKGKILCILRLVVTNPLWW